MTDNKLTNEQIIKVLELCIDEGDCKECLCYGGACITDNDVLDLIKRQHAESEELREVIDDMSSYFPCCTNCEGKVDGLFNDKCMNLINHEFCAKKGLENIAQILRENEEQKAEIERLEEQYKFLEDNSLIFKGGIDYFKAEAIKEFAEKLHELLKFYYPEQKFVHTHIDNLVKEMTEQFE